jgi:heme/copper-type cytochrome/quinol oxidase subunit 2
MPCIGIKIDACPGRVNQISFTIDKAGIYRGQCSEFCGLGHGFMPIVIFAINTDK